MILQLLLSFAPFLALLYVVFALVQALRHKQQGIFAGLLALVALGVPLAAYLTASTTIQARVLTRLPIIAVILFVASLLILLIERRNKARDAGRSYGMLGIGLSIVFALAMFAAPLLTASTASTEIAAAEQESSQNASVDNSLVNVAERRSTTLEDTAQATPSVESETEAAEQTEVAQVMTEQTGLTADEITAQIEGGSTIADLVAANNGDLDAVVEAIAAALDEMTAASGMGGQMLSRLGSDTTAIATQLVQGELGQAQQFLLPMLLSGEMPQFSGRGTGGGAPPDGAQGVTPGDGFAPPNAEATPEATPEQTSDETSAPNAEVTPEPETSESTSVRESQSAPEPTATAEPLEATEPVIRPTRIVFPTATPTPVATETPVAAEEGSATETTNDSDTGDANSATCVLVVNYNLNLRDQPTQEGSTVLLSIPFGTTVNADGVTEDGWYSVSYDGTSGWVTGEYVTPSSSCAELLVGG